MLGAKIMRGDVTQEEARRLQRQNTKNLTSAEWEAAKLDTNWAVDYYHKTGGLVKKDGQLVAGETVDSIFQRKAEMVQRDRAKEAGK